MSFVPLIENNNTHTWHNSFCILDITYYLHFYTLWSTNSLLNWSFPLNVFIFLFFFVTAGHGKADLDTLYIYWLALLYVVLTWLSPCFFLFLHVVTFGVTDTYWYVHAKAIKHKTYVCIYARRLSLLDKIMLCNMWL